MPGTSGDVISRYGRDVASDPCLYGICVDFRPTEAGRLRWTQVQDKIWRIDPAGRACRAGLLSTGRLSHMSGTSLSHFFPEAGICPA